MPLSDRVRPNVEAAPWVIEKIKGLESGLALASELAVKAETALAALEAKLEARRVPARQNPQPLNREEGSG